MAWTIKIGGKSSSGTKDSGIHSRLKTGTPNNYTLWNKSEQEIDSIFQGLKAISNNLSLWLN